MNVRTGTSPNSCDIATQHTEYAAPITEQSMNRSQASNNSVSIGMNASQRTSQAESAAQDLQVIEGYGTKANEAARSPEAQWQRYDAKYQQYSADKAQYDEDKAAWDRYQTDLAAWQKTNAANAKTNAGIDRKIAALEREKLILGAAETLLGLGGSILADGRITREELEGILRGEFGTLHTCALDEHSIGQMKSAAQALIDNPALLEKLMSVGGALTVAAKQSVAASIETALDAEREKRVTDDPAPTPPPAGNPGKAPRPPTPPSTPRPASMGPAPTASNTSAASGSTSAAATGSTQSASGGAHGTGATTSTGSTNGSTAAGATPATTQHGWAGVLDKIQGSMDKINDDLDRLGDLEAKEARGEQLSPQETKDLKELRAREKHLTRQLTDLANRMKMYTELMSAMSKLFSDISMSIIRKIG